MISNINTVTKILIEENTESILLTLDEYINKALTNNLQFQFKNFKFNQTFNWSFTKGLIFGQLSIILILIIFLKFFIFNETNRNDKLKELKKIPIIENNDNLLNDKDSYISTINSILEKTYYNVETHSPESLDWFNVFIAQFINQFRKEILISNDIINLLNEFLDKTKLPEFLDKINIIELDIGNDYPIFSNCRIKRNPLNLKDLQGKIDVDLSDTLTIGIDTNLLLNKPKPLKAILPIQISVSIVRFSGCLTISLINDEDKGTALMFAFAPDFRLEFNIKSLIGSRSKLENVPKISHLIENQLKAWFIERCVEPKYQIIKLPSMFPKK